MVFGWGKKKEDKKEEKHVEQEAPQNKEIQYSDIPKVIADLKQLRESQTTSEIKHLRNSTAPLIEELMKIGDVLEKDNLKVDDIDKHLAIIVVRGKKQVISVIKKDVLPLPEVKTIEDASKLNSLLNQILKKVGDVLGRQTRVIHIFAKKYAEQLKNNLEVMNSNHAEIQKLLKNYQDGKELSEQILQSVSEIDKMKKLKQEKLNKVSETENILSETSNSVSSLEKSFKEIKSSEHYKKYLELESSLNNFTKEKSQIKSSIDAQFTKISRPLSRYEYGSSLDKEQKNLLTQLVNDPFTILLAENKDSIITILENVRKGINSGSISVKDQDKSMQQITEVEESLDSLILRVSSYSEKFNSLQNELDSYDLTDFNTKKNDLEKNSSLHEELQLKLESFQGEINEYEVKIPSVISEVQIMMQNYSNTKYVVLDS
ncbi:exonuclease SbcC [Nitrosopumilus sp.]|uniref:exonuclease SbcC n=1 Tax=Nitrosopumilus sp. TaxID=2024843 RepID=UPI00260C3EDC|nr:exonuclease SbcC [Nitrosopumilus sp.]